ncbi:YraN family protein [Falsiroseomonas ponticola]|jgi:putative endonuclease|uniref:YraN family protein n=1 Tax=Falsiroseomonas ponticola TaxID=2786951 RepID=UPI001932DAE7|nr:YraN family protein [Roseomonas ponticola]
MRDPVMRRASEGRGRHAESQASAALAAEGFSEVARRVRTGVGEIDLVVERDGLLVFVEVKARATLGEAAVALGPRQQARLLAAGEAWMAANPGHGAQGVRFDLLLVDGAGRVRRIADVIRQW